jgi:hypothetical protein
VIEIVVNAPVFVRVLNLQDIPALKKLIPAGVVLLPKVWG